MDHSPSGHPRLETYRHKITASITLADCSSLPAYNARRGHVRAFVGNTPQPHRNSTKFLCAHEKPNTNPPQTHHKRFTIPPQAHQKPFTTPSQAHGCSPSPYSGYLYAKSRHTLSGRVNSRSALPLYPGLFPGKSASTCWPDG